MFYDLSFSHLFGKYLRVELLDRWELPVTFIRNRQSTFHSSYQLRLHGDLRDAPLSHILTST